MQAFSDNHRKLSWKPDTEEESGKIEGW